mmetsp:Transcript_363/g.346  ORF Transcript_363/g.346 Transcript_363/m.346 type:complete len:212 (+) Transcript_363:73-708(+)
MMDSCPRVPIQNIGDNPFGALLNIEFAIASVFPFIANIVILIRAFWKKNLAEKLFIPLTLVSLLVCEILLKTTIRQHRPDGACSHSYGMPSGHSSFSWCLIMWSLYSYYTKLNHRLWVPVCILFIGINVIISRIFLVYHTPLQVTIGSIVGIVISSVYFSIIHFKTNLVRQSTPRAVVSEELNTLLVNDGGGVEQKKELEEQLLDPRINSD